MNAGDAAAPRGRLVLLQDSATGNSPAPAQVAAGGSWRWSTGAAPARAVRPAARPAAARSWGTSAAGPAAMDCCPAPGQAAQTHQLQHQSC